jgi:hypothetical protein
VNASNHALERFGLAQVARKQAEIAPALERALAERPGADASFAKRPSTATLILGNERRVRQLPSWRLRTVRAAAAGAVALSLAAWSLTAGMAFSLVSAVAHTHALTKVTIAKPEVGVMVDANAREVAHLAQVASAEGIHLSFAIYHGTEQSADWAQIYGDEEFPRLPDGGLVQWTHTKTELRHMAHQLGWGHHFLYASSGPSLGQWLFAHADGGRLIAGAIRITPGAIPPRHLRAGDVIELRVEKVSTTLRQLRQLNQELDRAHLAAVPVSRLLHDSGTPE